MNWNLILGLSLFGLVMGIGSVFFIPPNIEPILWLVIFLLCTYLIARSRSTSHFLHGFLLGLANCVWITSAHILFYSQYLARHTKEAAMMQSMPLPNHPRLMMALFGPVVGILSGIIIGLRALAAANFVKLQAPGPTAPSS